MGASKTIAAQLLLLLLLAGCEPDRRQLVIILDDAIEDEIVTFEVFIVRPDLGSAAPEPDAAPDASLPGDAAPDGGIETPTRPRTCSDLLARASDLDFPEALFSARFTADETLRLGPIGEGQVLVLVRGRDATCRLYQGCQEVEIESGNEAPVHVELSEPSMPLEACPARYRCESGQCQSCGGCCENVECNDHDPTTTDICESGMCSIAEDFDDDGSPAPADCDDRIWEAQPGAFAACGYNLDHDCDGLVDELDSCHAPSCWLEFAEEIERRPDLRAQSLAPFGSLIAAALHAEPNATMLWIGDLDEGHLVEVGSVRIEGTEGGLRPQDLVIYHQTAFILTSYTQSVAVVDISSPGTPVHLGTIDLGQTRLSQSISISPPLLWVSRIGGVDVLDISQVDLGWGWPEVAAVEIPLAGVMAIAFSVDVRFGSGYVLNGSPSINCFDLDSPAEYPLAAERCFAASFLTERPDLHQAYFDDLFVGDDRALYAASRSSGTGAEATPPALWRIPLDEGGRPTVEGVRVGVVSGDPKSVVVAGGTIVRSTARGLVLHPTELFDTVPGVEIDFDDDTENNGPTVWETLIFGTIAVAAVEGVGLVTLELSCHE